MRLKIFLILIFSFCLTRSPVFGQSDRAAAINLEKAIGLALKNNERILMASNDVQDAHAQIREAWAEALPDITFNGLYTRNFKQQVIFLPEIIFVPGGDPDKQIPVTFSSKNAYAFTLHVEQPLFQAGKVSGGIKAANLYKKFSNQGYRAVRGDLVLSVKRAYYTVQLNEQLLEINQQSLDQQLANLENTRKLFEQGQVSELDTLRAWVDYINLQPRLIQMENNLRISKNRLKELIGLDLNDPIQLIDELYFEETNGITFEQIEQEALRNRPELKQLEFQSNILKHNIGIIRADHLPKLYLSGTYQSVAQSNRFDFGEGLQSSISGAIRLEVPIFKGFRTSARVQRAKLDYKNSKFQLEMFRDNLKIEVNSILLKLKEAKKRVQVQQNAIKQAERALFMSERRYIEGVGTQLELGDSLLALNITKTNYVQAVYDHKIALAELNKVIGRE
ncbi:MAG: TolC family protein [bacterium]